MNNFRPLSVFLTVLALFLVAILVVLSSVSYFLAIDPAAYIPESEISVFHNSTQERVQRIIHQTWKTEILPPRWRGISQACRDMMPDYKYILWTDAMSRQFISEHYPWFLDTFDNYRYPIQRADAIRYFVLYHYGGVYIDLDIGCLQPVDPLLAFPVILPKTAPVGISNDLIFAERGHPFFKQTIENLRSFDHSWILNYPTVMFSTGPMFLSAQYGLYASAHPDVAGTQVRILPKALYGQEGRAPRSFFSHFYGSSWHADDAAFIDFLNTWGKTLMWLTLFILIIGSIHLSSKLRRSFPSLSRSGRWRFHFGQFSFTFSSPQSPTSNDPGSPVEGCFPFLHIPFNIDFEKYAGRSTNPFVETFRHIRNRVGMMGERYSPPNSTHHRQFGRGTFFLPAVLTTPPELELQRTLLSRSTRTPSGSRHGHGSISPKLERHHYCGRDVESGIVRGLEGRKSRPDCPNDDEYVPLVGAASSPFMD